MVLLVMSYDFIQESGIVIADTSTVSSEITQEYLDNFGSKLDVTSGEIAKILINTDTENVTKLQETLAFFANLLNPRIAGGKYLDAIWSLTEGQRSLATSTTVVATIAGVIGTFIPAGSVATTGDGNRFALVADITIPISGTIDTSFASESKGAIVCQAGTLINIADGGVLGWETINNASEGIIGNETQSDTSARSDRILTISKGAKGTELSIISGLYAIDEVTSLIFRKNDENTSVTIDNVVMSPKSIYVCIDGGDNTLIAKSLEEYKSVGASYNNGGGINQSVTFTSDASSQPYTVLFDRPNLVLIKIKITVKVGSSSTDTTQEIKNSILSYVNSEVRNNGFKVGVDVSPIEIAANTAIDTGSFVSDCQVTKVTTNVFQRETIPIEIYEKANTSNTLIEVVLV